MGYENLDRWEIMAAPLMNGHSDRKQTSMSYHESIQADYPELAISWERDKGEDISNIILGLGM